MQRVGDVDGSTRAAIEEVREALARLRETLVASTMTPSGGALWLGHDVELAALVAEAVALEALAAGAAGEAAILGVLPSSGA